MVVRVCDLLFYQPNERVQNLFHFVILFRISQQTNIGVQQPPLIVSQIRWADHRLSNILCDIFLRHLELLFVLKEKARAQVKRLGKCILRASTTRQILEIKKTPFYLLQLIDVQILLYFYIGQCTSYVDRLQFLLLPIMLVNRVTSFEGVN